MPPTKPPTTLPWWVTAAEREVRGTFGLDLWACPASVRNRVLLAACEAEAKGEQAVKHAVFEMWRRIRRRQQAKAKRKERAS